MDIGGLLERSWNVVWNNKYLLILGILIAIGSGRSSGGGSNYSKNFSDPNNTPLTQFEDGDFSEEDLQQLVEDYAPQIAPMVVGLGALIFALICVLFIIAIIFWLLSIIARGGLIASVSQIETEGASSFGRAWQAGMGKFLPLFGIELIQSVPVLLILFAMVAAVIGIASSADLNSPDTFFGVFAVIGSLCCLLFIIMLFVGLLKKMAFRACILEDAGVFEAYGRSFEVVKENIGQIALLILLQIGIGVVSAIVLFPIGLISSLCCLLFPVMWVIQGAFETYYSTMWTLAWRDWTGMAGKSDVVIIEKAPGV